MVNDCLVTTTDAWSEDGDQYNKNDHSPQGVRSLHHVCKINGIHEEDQRGDFYPCHQVLCVSRS